MKEPSHVSRQLLDESQVAESQVKTNSASASGPALWDSEWASREAHRPISVWHRAPTVVDRFFSTTKARDGYPLLGAIMNAVPEGVVVIGGPPDFPIKMVSRFATETLKRAATEMVGISTAGHQRLLRIFQADGKTVPKSDQMPSYRATRFGEEVRDCELVVYGRDDRRVDVLVDAVPIRDEAQNVVGAVCFWRDVTPLNEVKHVLKLTLAQLEHDVEERTRVLNAANERLRCEVDRRQLLENRLVAMLENEHRQIGRDLHDNIGSQLSGIELLCEAMLRKGYKASARQSVRTIARLLREAIEDTRQLAHSMAPVPLSPHGLALSLRALANVTRKTTRCRCTMRSHGAEVTDPSVALHLYRIAQEAIANAARHGEAHQIAITLESRGDGVRLMIRDDGHGIPDPLPEHLGLGIATMNIRANAIGGSLSVNRNPLGGTDVICSIPKLANRSEAPDHP